MNEKTTVYIVGNGRCYHTIDWFRSLQRSLPVDSWVFFTDCISLGNEQQLLLPRDRNSGEKQERTQWHNIAIFSEPLVNIAERFLKKGSKIFVEGQLETRKWQDNTGADRYSTEVVLRPYKGELTLLDNKPETDNTQRDSVSESTTSVMPQNLENSPSFEVDDFDDEIPF